MAAELGHFALILAFCLALPQAFFGLAGAAYAPAALDGADERAPSRASSCSPRSRSRASRTRSIMNDFSVLYVAQNSNSELPTFYRFAAVWGAHEGSLLLWLLVQAIWTLAVAAFSRNMPRRDDEPRARRARA